MEIWCKNLIVTYECYLKVMVQFSDGYQSTFKRLLIDSSGINFQYLFLGGAAAMR